MNPGQILLIQRCDKAVELLRDCRLCPRECGVNRLNGETGICNTGYRAMVSSYAPHFGEEPPLVGRNGSGTIFFTHCSLQCNFCQNWDISHQGNGMEVSASHLARIMLELQSHGCHNINFVTPSHVIPQILQALVIASDQGLSIPLVYNSSGYDELESLKLLDGIIDIYMPDFKFWDQEVASETCDAPDYPDTARLALLEMHRQVGDLEIINGIASKGLIVRHLIMPEGKAGTNQVLNFLTNEISSNTYVNIMDQYHPCGEAWQKGYLSRRITQDEYVEAMRIGKEKGLRIDAGF